MTSSSPGWDEAPFSVQIEGLHCAGCVSKAERVLRAVPGISTAHVNLVTGAAQVEGRPKAGAGAIVAAIASAGFKAAAFERQLSLSGLHCASCVAKVETALRCEPGVIEAAVNLATARARPNW